MGSFQANSGSFSINPENGRVPLGRKPGVPNKATTIVKNAFLMVFQKLQEDPDEAGPSLEAWARRETTEFYKISSKLFPLEIEAVTRKVITVKILDDDDQEELPEEEVEYIEYEDISPNDLI
jgi:hypothetical protein